VDEQLHGKGVLHYPNGDQYSGNWVNNQRSGEGIYTSADGRQYIGQVR
jgi:hypothetical protein